MAGPYIMRKGVSSVTDLKGGHAAIGLGVGNVYYVIKSTEAYYDQFLTERQGVYNDGSVIVHTDIQSALDATVECRNDYVIVQPADADYDITETLTMTKKAVHLICPAGMTGSTGATNACRIHQTTGDIPILQIADAGCEVAGFYLKSGSGASPLVTGVEMIAGCYGVNIHHNYFCVNGVTGDGPVLGGTGATGNGAWGIIHHNRLVTITSGVTFPVLWNFPYTSYSLLVEHNSFSIQTGVTISTAVINMSGGYGEANFNTFSALTTFPSQGLTAPSIEACIHLGGGAGGAIGNRGAILTGDLLSGGTANAQFSDNFDAASGGAAVES